MEEQPYVIDLLESAIDDGRAAEDAEGIFYFYEKVTPIVARKFLLYQHENQDKYRGISNTHLSNLAQTVADDRWVKTVSNLRFTMDGIMINGSHRCHMCMLSGLSFDTKIEVGYAYEDYESMDVDQRSRDLATVAGVYRPYAHVVAKLVQLEPPTSEGSARFSRPTPVRADVGRWYFERYREEIEFVCSVPGKALKDSSTLAALVRGLVYSRNKDDRDPNYISRESVHDFLVQLRTGDMPDSVKSVKEAEKLGKVCAAARKVFFQELKGGAAAVCVKRMCAAERFAILYHRKRCRGATTVLRGPDVTAWSLPEHYKYTRKDSIVVSPSARKEVGRALKAAREAAKFSQGALAKKIKSSQTVVSHQERGLASIPVGVAMMWLKKCGKTPEDVGLDPGKLSVARTPQNGDATKSQRSGGMLSDKKILAELERSGCGFRFLRSIRTRVEEKIPLTDGQRDAAMRILEEKK